MTDTAIVSPNQDAEATRPRNSFALSTQLSILADPAGPQAESIRVLRTHLTAQHLRDGRRSLAICAPSEGAGCSYLASNLAVALAQTGIKTLLIDANLRQPGIDQYFAPTQPMRGLYHFLADTTLNAGDVIEDEVQPNLSLMLAGGATPNAQELLGGAAFKGLIDTCVRDFDLTIVDTPPANSSADARRIASVLRYALVVARRGKSYVKDLRTLMDELNGDRVRVIGSYLNDY